ncbi:transport and Golgi organization protein 6 [Bombyx mandarina]|uniref:Transport and Golgi organization protein 6 n=1 Tax=Bombyx mandarina TaxID=7092 RepID=A0A6J2KM08_BOMMA|nr:transport and Golgi organization protein 6 [Bombyx mandarina]
MSEIKHIFTQLENFQQKDGPNKFISMFINEHTKNQDKSKGEPDFDNYVLLKDLLHKIFEGIDELATEIRKDDTLLISVKQQKVLRTCFQLVASLGVSTCLIPGLGISISKRCSFSNTIPSFNLTQEQKYSILVDCTDFIHRSYEIPVYKNIIMTLHLSDYLAALIQLSFAPLKKPGTYKDFVMTEEMYKTLTNDRQKYLKIYDNLVSTCFQPTLMKELLVLQSITDPTPPAFLQRVISNEMSKRLLASGGLLSLIRCFIESYNADTGCEWKKIDMICRIVSVVHKGYSKTDYLKNMCSQLKQVLSLNNRQYSSTGIACLLTLYDKYKDDISVSDLVKGTFNTLNYETMISNSKLPGTLIFSPQEIEQKINILHSCTYLKIEWPAELIKPNIYVLFLIGAKCTKNVDMQTKVKELLLRCMEQLNKEEVSSIIYKILIEQDHLQSADILVEEYDAGVTIKAISEKAVLKKDQLLIYFLKLFEASGDSLFVANVFEVSLLIATELNIQRKKKPNKDMLLVEDDDPVLIDKIDEQYALILQLLSEISDTPKITRSLKKNPLIVVQFIEYFIVQNYNSEEECSTVALVLLNIILSNAIKGDSLQSTLDRLKPVLEKISKDDSNYNHLLAKEALSYINTGNCEKINSKYEKAVADVLDFLLPVRAHGLIELTKLIDSADPETISKKHYIFCIFQELLKDNDSYIYLSAINGLASLCIHCTEDVLHVLCKEFLKQVSEQNQIVTQEVENKIAELRMKIGDVIVQVTKRLGDMAIVHKTVLLNTMLCGCRDDDPLIRTSAISNLAEIARVLHYKMGTIIYEVLLCIWNIIGTDNAVECRRAAVMVIANLIKGLGKETLLELKDNLLPIYRTLKNVYRDENEDPVLRLHAQLALEELNDVVKDFLFPEIKMEKQIFVIDRPDVVYK